MVTKEEAMHVSYEEQNNGEDKTSKSEDDYITYSL